MSKIDWSKFTLRIPVRASRTALYKAWTTRAELEHWFLRRAELTGADGRPLKRTEKVTEGCTFTWEWYGYDGREEGRIMKANGRDHLRFTFADPMVDVILKKQGSRVVVELTQSGIPTDGSSRRDIWIGCHRGWTFWLTNLKCVHESGHNLRNTNAALKGMLNN